MRGIFLKRKLNKSPLLFAAKFSFKTEAISIMAFYLLKTFTIMSSISLRGEASLCSWVFRPSRPPSLIATRWRRGREGVEPQCVLAGTEIH